jgi:hypothetical protein
VAGFLVRGTFHAISCGAVRPDAVSGERVAVGRYAGRSTEVRRLDDVEAGVLLAVRLPGGLCDDEDRRPLSQWSMLLPAGAETADQNKVICEVAVAEHLERNKCSR